MVTGAPCTETRSHELAPKHLPVHRGEGDNRRPEMDGSMCGSTPRRRPVRGSEFKPAILTGKRHEFIRSFALNFLLCRACIRVDTSRQAGSGICSIAVSPVEATAWAVHHACIFPQERRFFSAPPAPPRRKICTGVCTRVRPYPASSLFASGRVQMQLRCVPLFSLFFLPRKLLARLRPAEGTCAGI
jgi:hypothetical protein